ncbi:MAG: hypothetical protein QOI94_3083, partial [Acidobacteriaceae bacterium]|nr:hypothetical protein [Acidobacteriaceae bacterium]
MVAVGILDLPCFILRTKRCAGSA